MEEKSFYDLDYIIQINEQRLDQYNIACQKVLDRLTHIIIIYSAMAVFFIPLIKDGAMLKIKDWHFIISLILFLSLLSISVSYAIKLIILA